MESENWHYVSYNSYYCPPFTCGYGVNAFNLHADKTSVWLALFNLKFKANMHLLVMVNTNLFIVCAEKVPN